MGRRGRENGDICSLKGRGEIMEGVRVVGILGGIMRGIE